MAVGNLQSSQSGPSVLLVEDDQYLGLALKIRLQAAGFSVRVARSASKALEEIDALVPDIALIDYNLPDGTGVTLMQSLLQNQAASEMRAIVMSASKKIGLKEEAIKHGAVDFFEKPFDSSRLVESINRAVKTTLH